MRLALAAAALLAFAARDAGAQALVLDQEQLLYNGGTSARTLPGYTIWQSFTAGADGTLAQIDMGFFNDMSGQAQLDVIEGDGPTGAILQSLTVPVVGVTAPGVTWNSWAVNVQVVSGAAYTFRITPDAATLPDPYGVAIGATDPYPGGVMGIDDPSGSYPTPFDVVFRTWLAGSPPAPRVWRSETPDDVEDPAHVIGTAPASRFDDPAPPDVPILYYTVEDDVADLLIRASMLPGGGVRLEF